MDRRPYTYVALIIWLLSNGLRAYPDTGNTRIAGLAYMYFTNINVLGVIFHQKLQWADHVAHCITKSKKALTAIRMIRHFFNTNELLQLINSNYYSILYYNSEIWLLSSLKANLKQKLLSSSANAIRVCVKYCTRDVSFANLHERYHRATPHQFMLYKHALSLHKLMNSADTNLEWSALLDLNNGRYLLLQS